MLVSKEQLIKKVQSRFNKQFEIEPKLLTLTPGRVNIIGEHTDYNEGLAIPVAIDRWICTAVCKSPDNSSTIYSLNYNKNLKINQKRVIKNDTIWKQLAQVTMHQINIKFDIDVGVNLVVGGNIPIGCGLSSSTAFVISLVYSICQLFSIDIKAHELVIFCHKLENLALGNAGGQLDQCGIILSKKDQFLFIDFQDGSIEYIPAVLNDCSWIVINSQIRRELSESAYLNRVKECQQGLNLLKEKYKISSLRDTDRFSLEILRNKYDVLYNRLCHVINENQRVLRMKKQLILGNAKLAGEILSESHESLKSLYEVSCNEIDYIIETSKLIEGWYGGRIIGGGFGGCSIHLVENKMEEKFIDYISNNYSRKFNIIPQIMKVAFPGGLQLL